VIFPCFHWYSKLIIVECRGVRERWGLLCQICVASFCILTSFWLSMIFTYCAETVRLCISFQLLFCVYILFTSCCCNWHFFGCFDFIYLGMQRLWGLQRDPFFVFLLLLQLIIIVERRGVQRFIIFTSFWCFGDSITIIVNLGVQGRAETLRFASGSEAVIRRCSDFNRQKQQLTRQKRPEL